MTQKSMTQKSMMTNISDTYPRPVDTPSDERLGCIFSGIQPSGGLHLGNYLGAVRHWVSLQDCARRIFYCLVDCHAITVSQERLREQTLSMAAALLACGIDAERSVLFVQSSNPHHTELGWMLSCVARMGWLSRMTQFKEKAGKDREQASVGLYAYPVLMAADILLYGATHVPVGDDQKQHLELTRDIAQRFNKSYGEDIFSVPEPLIFSSGARVMSLRDGSVKMSKSESSPMGRIDLTDGLDAIASKIRKAKTDSAVLPSKEAGLEGRAEAKNLVGIYAALRGVGIAEVLESVGGMSFAKFKDVLIGVLEEVMVPKGEEMRRLCGDKNYLIEVLRKGRERARALSEERMKKVREAMGFLEVG